METGIYIKFEFERKDADFERLIRIIIKKGGKIWEKDAKKRAYFSDDCCSEAVLPNKFFQIYECYFDVNQKSLYFWVNKKDFEQLRYSPADLKTAILDALR